MHEVKMEFDFNVSKNGPPNPRIYWKKGMNWCEGSIGGSHNSLGSYKTQSSCPCHNKSLL